MQAIIYFVPLFLACSDAQPIPEAPQAVRLVEARLGDVVEGRSYLGELVSESEVRVLARVQGTVGRFDAPEGAEVRPGDALVRLFTPDLVARLDRVRTEATRAAEERDFVCEQLETDRALFAAGDLTGFRLASSERACASAELAVEAAEAAEREVEAVGARSVERAPFHGEVLGHLVDPGQSVMPGTPLIRVGSQDRLLRLRVPQQRAQEVQVGTRAVSELGSGEVVAVAVQALGPGRLVQVDVALDQPIDDVPVGTSWTVTLVSHEWQQATSVPETAIGRDDAGAFVLLVEGDSVVAHTVEVGPRDSGWVAVTPLPDGAVLVADEVDQVDTDRPVFGVTP